MMPPVLGAPAAVYLWLAVTLAVVAAVVVVAVKMWRGR
jgi:heme exporter protein D